MSKHNDCAAHWLRAVGDPQVGRVLTAMHGDMERLLTVEELLAGQEAPARADSPRTRVGCVLPSTRSETSTPI
jgi:hypothetical protein